MQIIFKAILPRKLDRNIPFGADLVKMLREMAEKIEAELLLPTKGWKHVVQHSNSVTVVPGLISMQVEIKDGPYFWINSGTKAHFVAPVNAQALHWIQNGEHAFSKGHKVSGIKARNWTKAVRKKYNPMLRQKTKDLVAKHSKSL